MPTTKEQSMLTKKEKLALRNFANAQYSTGPKTPEGKARTSMNALKHGLAGQTILLPSEHAADLQRFQKEYFDELRPKGVLERQLTQTLADLGWALNRASAIENNIFAMGQFANAHLIETDDTRVLTAMVAAKTASKQVHDLEKYSRYEQRKLKMYTQTMNQLRELQKERREEEKHQLVTAASSTKQTISPDSRFESPNLDLIPELPPHEAPPLSPDRDSGDITEPTRS
jgi:hypothetical protein